MSAVRGLTPITPWIWIPPQYTAVYKLTVERSDGTIDDITDIIVSAKIKDGTTEGIGSFEFEIPNPNETYTDIWTGMEIFRFYSDYSTAATTLRFRGRIEKPSKRNNNVLVTGRGEALFVHEQTIHKDYTDEDAGAIIYDLFDSYGESRYDLSEIDISTGTTLTLTFADIPFWDAIEAVCEASGYDCYVSAGLVVKFFEAGSVTNTSEGIVHTYNLLEVGDFAPDLQFVKNQVRVIGGTIDGFQVMYTANDTDSQDSYGLRRETVSDDGVVTLAAAKELAEFIMAEKKDAPIIGDVKGLLLATIQPGEKIRLSSPMEGIQPGAYRIISYEHSFGPDGAYTTVTMNKASKRISHILKERIQRENKQGSASANPDDLDYAAVELFNADVGAHTDTEITTGVLKVASGASGSWISPAFGPGDGRIFSQVKIDLVGDVLTGATIEISHDGGVNYQTVTRNQLVTLNSGITVIVKLTLATGTQIDTLLVQYSMTT
jgi:hypothetical protein